MRDAEYDRFGPWILEITETDPLPPLFMPYVVRTETPLLSIKIPRHIERRNASPGMNLYDYVINLYEDDFDIFKREEDSVVHNNFRYVEVDCIRHREELLRGTIMIYCTGSVYELSFSTVSNDLIGRMVDIIRERYTNEQRTVNLSGTDPGEDELDFYFSNLAAAETREHPDSRLFAYQPRLKLSSIEDGGLRKFFNFIVSKQLLESLHFVSSRELKITSRGRAFKYLYQPVYGKENCYIPLSGIRSVGIAEDPEENALRDCNIETGSGVFTYKFEADNPTAGSYSVLG